MRRSDKAAARFAVAALAFVLAAAVLYFTGWAAVAKNVVVLGWRGNAMVNLAKRTPFTPPAAGGVSENRLEAYLTVCARIKPLGDRIDEWEAAHSAPGRRVSFKGRAAGLVGTFLRELDLALEEQRMGPAEFAWIEGRMRQAGEPSSAAPESDRILYAAYRGRLSGSALGSHARRIAMGFAD